MRIKPGERVLLALPNTPHWIIAYYGILKIGAVAVLCDATAEREVVLSRIAETDAVMLITASNRYDELRDIVRSDVRAAINSRPMLHRM
jgi:long-chain acyl-CoA synthetase